MLEFSELVVLPVLVVVAGNVGKASAAAARSAKKRSNSDDVKDSWSLCAPGWTEKVKVFSIFIKYNLIF